MGKRMIYFRVYPDITRNRKIRELDFEGRWLWVVLLSIASENNGRIEKDIDRIAHHSRISVENVKKAISDMLEVKLLEEDENHYIPCNDDESPLFSFTSSQANYMRE